MNPWELDYGLTEDQQKELDMLLIIDENAAAKQARDAEAARALKAQAEDTGAIEATLVGMGREYKKVGSGTADLVDKGLEALGSESATNRRKTRAEDWKEEDRQYGYLSDERPVSTTVGTMLPYLATIPLEAVGAVRAAGSAPTWISNLIKPIAGKGNIFTNWLGRVLHGAAVIGGVAGREAAIGGAQGALHYDDTALNGALWGAGGSLAGMYLGKLAGSGANRLNPELQRIVNFGRDNGIFIPPGMRTGNSRLQQLDRAMQTYPMTADRFNDLLQRSKEAENRLISRELGGETADIFSSDYLQAQRRRIQDTMDNLVANTQGALDQNHAYRATDILDDFRNTDPTGAVPRILQRYEDSIYDLASSGQPLTGTKYEALITRLNKAANKQYTSVTGDRHLGRALSEIANIFHDGISSGLGSANRSAWDDARRQFALLNAIENNKNIAGYVDIEKLAKDFSVSENINHLAEVEKWRKMQPPNSLSTSGMLARMLSSATHNPSQAVGMASLLGSRMSKGVLGLDSFLTGLYLSGYPHVTGFAPFAGKYTYDAVERGVPRLFAADPNIERDYGDL